MQGVGISALTNPNLSPPSLPHLVDLLNLPTLANLLTQNATKALSSGIVPKTIKAKLTFINLWYFQCFLISKPGHKCHFKIIHMKTEIFSAQRHFSSNFTIRYSQQVNSKLNMTRGSIKNSWIHALYRQHIVLYFTSWIQFFATQIALSERVN